MVKSYHEKITKKLNELLKTLLRFSITWNKEQDTRTDILREYVKCYYEYFEFDQFDHTF